MSRLTEHYGVLDFLGRLAAANDAPDLTDNDVEFLANIEAKFNAYGADMFFSDRQADYLESLAARGEGGGEGFDAENCEIIPAERFGKRRRVKEGAT
jgi:hypothetical protein